MFTALLIAAIVCFVLWIIGIITHALPGDLVQACLIVWIICLVLVVVLSVAGHAKFGVWY
jgi:hypothetical protein